MRPKNTHINWNTNFVLPLILLSIFASLLLYNPTAEGRTKMYWTGARSIDRAQTDGANLETLLPVTLSRPRYLAIDTSGGKIYWTDPGTGRIQRSNLDGTGVEDLVTTGLSAPEGIAVDAAGGKIYWTDFVADKIQRSNLDGTGVEDLVTTGLNLPRDIAVNASGGKIYWIDLGTDKIQRSNLDGTGVEDLFTGLSSPEGIAVDASGGKIYWTQFGTNKIQRSNLDGTGVENLVTTGAGIPVGIAVDASGSKIYWADRGTVDKIQRSNLDGTFVEDLVTTGLSFPQGIAVDASGSKIYWVDSGTNKIQRSNLDGTFVEDLVTTGLDDPRGIAVDASGSKIYWTDDGTDKIQRSNLDGTGVEDLVTTGLSSPEGIAVDASGGKIYWTDFGTQKIQRSNLDGTFVEDLVTGLSLPEGIAVDASGGKIYWADRGAVDKIQRSNLDGTGVEDLVTTGLIGPQGIAVDGAGGKIYWTEISANKIQRSNLDGTGVEDLVTGLSSPEGIAVDGAGGKIYWTNLGTDKIQRSNLDGTGVEDLVTGVFDPRFIALDVIPPMAISWAGSSSSDWGDANNWSPNLVPRAIDDVTIVSFTFSPILNVNATANNVTINSGSLNLNGKTLTITNDFQQNGGTLVMTNSADQMGVGNNFTLNTGASNTSSLTDGIIRIAGLFTQVGTGTDDFQASSNHTVALSGTGDQTISFGSTGTGSNNHFGHLRINKTSGKVSVISDMVVESNGLIFFTATTMEISADKAITLGGLETTATATITSPNPGVDRFDFTVSGAIDVDGLNFGSAKTNGLHVTDSGSFTKFDNVTFTNAQSGARHMRVEQQGPVNITFNSVSFDDTFGLGSGVNLTLEDTNPPFTGDGDVKLHVVNILGAGAGRSYEEEMASASINWGNEVDWINASGGTWNTASNWSTGSVPGASSEVFIVFSGSYTVTQDVSPTIASLTLGASGASAILSLNGQTLAITGDYVQDNGNLSMASSSDVMDVNGNYTVNGSDGITGTLSDGTIRIAGNFAQTGTGANDFHGISNHTTEVDGTSDQGISFVNAINHFGHLKIPQ